MNASRGFLVMAALALSAQAGCSGGAGKGCPPQGFKTRYRFEDSCATGVIVATTAHCKVLGTDYDSAAGDPSYDFRYEVLDAGGGGIPPPPVPPATLFVGYVYEADGGPFHLSDGGAPRAADGGLGNYRECNLWPMLDAGNTTFDCAVWSDPPIAGAVNVQLDHCRSQGIFESREEAPYEYP